jgi:oligopeptide/dipeptide ABC transporter ATP-binding protein
MPGHLVEIITSNKLINNSLHPYTYELINAIPSYHKFDLELNTTAGKIPVIDSISSRCRYIDRCSMKIDICSTKCPSLNSYKSSNVRCHLFDEKIRAMLTIKPTENTKKYNLSVP